MNRFYRILKTEDADRDLSKLDGSEKLKVEKILGRLRESGGKTGKHLSGLSSFREKKFGGKRICYLVYGVLLIVLFIGVSDKAQQGTINRVLLDLERYQKYVESFAKKFRGDLVV